MWKHDSLMACALLAVLLLPATARAVVVLKKGEPAPIMGYLVRQNGAEVVVRHQVAGAWRTTTVPRAEIDELIVTVAPQRLAELSPDQPQAYREYAEELAEKQRDPEARDAAIRLYAIAASLGDAKLRRSALLGLIALARTPEEERRFRAAAYLHDPEHDASIVASGQAAVPLQPSAPAAGAEIAQAIRLARQGKAAAAKAIAERPSVRAELAGPSSVVLTHDELLAACSIKPPDDRQLARLIQAELFFDPALAGGATTTASPGKGEITRWSDAVRSGLAPVASLDLTTLTEFDPQESVYRDGKWVKP